jgi:hypothetical protein
VKVRVRNYGDRLKMDARVYERYCDAVLDEQSWLYHTAGLLEFAQALQPIVDAAWASRSRWARARDSQPFPANSDAPIANQMLVFSFAIENLLKASLVRDKKTEYARQLKSKPVLPRELKEHDLVKLVIKAKEAAKVRADLGDDQEELFRRLTRRAIWSARYPVAVSAESMPGLQKFRDGELGSTSHETGGDAADAMRLVNELCRDLKLSLPRLSGAS